MKRLLTLCCCFLLASTLVASDTPKQIDRDTLSEALGHLIVDHLGNPGFDFNIDRVMMGMEEARKGNPSPLTEEEYEQALYALQEKSFTEAAEKNLSEANAFLKANAKNQDVTLLTDQIQYKIIQEGSGEKVEAESVPLVHYQGKFIDGTVFSGSAESGEGHDPIALPISETIPGIAQGLVGMREGEKRILYIHPEMAFGTSGFLPPNSLLIFEVEVVKAHTVESEERVALQEE